jgi:hypothetical protein
LFLVFYKIGYHRPVTLSRSLLHLNELHINEGTARLVKFQVKELPLPLQGREADLAGREVLHKLRTQIANKGTVSQELESKKLKYFL